MNATPREPFDAEEARIARLYGSLPRGEPSAALDARILAQARAAAANAPAKRRPWFLGAGLGTAAAAVFAAGIAWQLGVFKADRGLSSVPEQQPAVQEEPDRIDIEFMKQEQKREDAAKPPVTLEPQTAGEPREQAATAGGFAEKERRDAAKPFPGEAPAAATEVTDEPSKTIAPPPPPAPAAATEAMPAPAPMQDAATARPETTVAAPASPAAAQSRVDARAFKDDAADAEGQGDAALARQRTAREADAAAGARAEPAPAVSGIAAPGRTASNAATPRDEITAGSARLAKLAGLPPWAEDAALAPEPWLERIRDRVQAGDRQGAEHSLRRFVLAHPDHRVPRDLQRLLVE